MKISRKEIYKMTENNKNDSENIHDHMKNLEKFSMKRMALKSKFGFTKINHNYTEEERQVTETKVLWEAHIR